jgi:hypothetical protein
MAKTRSLILLRKVRLLKEDREMALGVEDETSIAGCK